MAVRQEIWAELDELHALGTLNRLRRLGAVIEQKTARQFAICRARAPRRYVMSQRMRRVS